MKNKWNLFVDELLKKETDHHESVVAKGNWYSVKGRSQGTDGNDKKKSDLKTLDWAYFDNEIDLDLLSGLNEQYGQSLRFLKSTIQHQFINACHNLLNDKTTLSKVLPILKYAIKSDRLLVFTPTFRELYIFSEIKWNKSEHEKLNKLLASRFNYRNRRVKKSQQENIASRLTSLFFLIS